VTLRPQRRPGPIRVVLYVADRALRADIADACEDADIAVTAPPPYPPPQAGEDLCFNPRPLAEKDLGFNPSPQAGEGREGEDADVALADRPVETAVPLIALMSDETRQIWPANVCAVVPRNVDAATLVAIITVVAAGYALMPRRDLAGKDISKDISTWADSVDAADELASSLTSREREVLALLAEGASNKEIARALALSVHTVKFHVASLTEKLGARSRVEAVAIAIRAGLVMV
jgi:DNA-binding CsgD family transcriptional regulator